MLFLVKLVHSLIAVFNFGCLFYMIWVHWTGRKSAFLTVCYVALAVESVVVLLYGFSCPISVMADRMWGPGTHSLLVPEPVTRYYLEIGAALLGVAVLVKIIRKSQM